MRARSRRLGAVTFTILLGGILGPAVALADAVGMVKGPRGPAPGGRAARRRRHGVRRGDGRAAMIRRAVLLGAVVVLAIACAKFPVVRPTARTDFYVLLPRAGAVGALVVTSEGQEQTLSRPFAAAKIGKPGTIETATTTEAEVRDAFGAALTAQPARPASFVLYFLLDSDELTPESQRVVGDIVSEIARRPVPEVLVIGHTDTTGSDEYND